jgi:UDP-2-acetamido-3-amino-2,3-dideoxy-glucuronate N-acetyltransferase
MQKSFTVHPQALVSSEAELAEGVRVWPFAQVLEGARIGQQSSVGHGCFVGRGVVIGARCKLQTNVSLFEGVTVEDDVFLGPQVTFTNVRRPRAFRSRLAEFEETLVGRGASVGAGAVIRAGIAIGQYAMVGAGAVVTKDVAPHALVVGNPARRRGWVCRCGEPLVLGGQQRAECRACPDFYQLDGEAVTLVSSAADVRSGLLL